LAVNLSDLAACGATPRVFTLALALPSVDEGFLEGFSRGLFALADAHGITLIGGDTTAGPLNICITVIGEAPTGSALLRSGARAGDDLYVSGRLGDARLALEVFRGKLNLPGEQFEQVRLVMECPQPRVALGQALRGVASSAIDLSDGLIGDLGHLLQASKVGASLALEALPHSPAMAGQPLAIQRECMLAGGDDYELLFSAPTTARAAVRNAAIASATLVTRIGSIDQAFGLRLLDGQGQVLPLSFAGFDHFQS
jgi:thiamine-monophosphate kinase